MNKLTIEEQIGDLLRSRQQTLALAESCTGGLIGHRLTEVPGSSAYLIGGVIAYSNESKLQLLNVQPQTLETYGAVSAEVASEMAVGAQRLFNTDLGLSVTGIAGPTGGTEEKPVGLTFVALATPEDVVVQQFNWSRSRSRNKRASSEASLSILLKYLTYQEGE